MPPLTSFLLSGFLGGLCVVSSLTCLDCKSNSQENLRRLHTMSVTTSHLLVQNSHSEAGALFYLAVSELCMFSSRLFFSAAFCADHVNVIGMIYTSVCNQISELKTHESLQLLIANSLLVMVGYLSVL